MPLPGPHFTGLPIMRVILLIIFSLPAFADSSYKQKWGYKSLSCELSKLATISIKGKKIKATHKKEKAKLKTVFTDLNTDKPKMIYPDQINLIKLKKAGNTYWLLSPQGSYATTLFIVNDKENWFIQQRSFALPTGGGHFYSWGGKCE